MYRQRERERENEDSSETELHNNSKNKNGNKASAKRQLCMYLTNPLALEKPYHSTEITAANTPRWRQQGLQTTHI
jgi:hypothetical protein